MEKQQFAQCQLCVGREPGTMTKDRNFIHKYATGHLEHMVSFLKAWPQIYVGLAPLILMTNIMESFALLLGLNTTSF